MLWLARTLYSAEHSWLQMSRHKCEPAEPSSPNGKCSCKQLQLQAGADCSVRGRPCCHKHTCRKRSYRPCAQPRRTARGRAHNTAGLQERSSAGPTASATCGGGGGGVSLHSSPGMKPFAENTFAADFEQLLPHPATPAAAAAALFRRRLLPAIALAPHLGSRQRPRRRRRRGGRQEQVRDRPLLAQPRLAQRLAASPPTLAVGALPFRRCRCRLGNHAGWKSAGTRCEAFQIQ